MEYPYLKLKCMINKIGLFTSVNFSNIRGCWKVTYNLIEGLKKLGVEVSLNKLEKYNGCLSNDSLNASLLPFNTLIGPEIMVLPNENPQAWQTWKHWVQPAQWVIDYMVEFGEVKGCNFFVWPVGVDTDRFNDLNRGNFEYDCFVYYKNVTKQTPTSKLDFITRGLTKRKLKYKILTYGSYAEEELIQCTKNCRFAIFVIGTESQNIALMETLSSNVPVYIFDETTFKYQDYAFSNANVSGAPYFSSGCGTKFHELTFDLFDKFLKNLNNYNPREYILKNHTLIKGAEKYLDILLKTHGPS
jgi:hypothetical protein